MFLDERTLNWRFMCSFLCSPVKVTVQCVREPFLPLLALCSSSPYGFHGNRPIRLVITPHISYSSARWAVYIGVHVCVQTVWGRCMSLLKVKSILCQCHFTVIHRDYFLK